ncbi:MAG TPA: hypothetical protein VK570_06035 [Rubrivivax sp.]|jgi:hypothetical protein|nr:hypothetical protein [Rubrivivax sp.]
MFQSTQPNDSALMRISDYEREHGGPSTQGDAGATRLASLNPSLMQDLMRFERGHLPGGGLNTLELLGVLAAALRHDRALLIHLQLDYRVIPVTVRPAERQFLSPLPLPQLLELRLPDLGVLRVEPAPDEPSPGLHASRLSPLLWELALRGSREALLPEIAGVAAYRVTPGADLRMLDLVGSLGAAVARLRQQAAPLREIASWPGFDRGRASRLLNGLYLQAALMVTRTHPSAISNN